LIRVRLRPYPFVNDPNSSNCSQNESSLCIDSIIFSNSFSGILYVVSSFSYGMPVFGVDDVFSKVYVSEWSNPVASAFFLEDPPILKCSILDVYVLSKSNPLGAGRTPPNGRNNVNCGIFNSDDSSPQSRMPNRNSFQYWRR